MKLEKVLWEKLLGGIDSGALPLDQLARTGKPNDALVGPAANQPEGDAVAPIYAVSATELYATLIERISRTGNMEWLEQDHSALYARAATYSPSMRFPDINHIWALPIEYGTATLTLYAAARLGYSDMGKNRKRLDGWLRLLNDIPMVE